MRSAYSLLSSVVQPFDFFTEQFSCPNWNQDIDLNLQVMQELSLLKNQLHNINGQPILTSKTGVCLNEILRKISNNKDDLGGNR